MSVTSEQGIESVVIFFEDCSVFLLRKFGKTGHSSVVRDKGIRDKNIRSKHMLAILLTIPLKRAYLLRLSLNLVQKNIAAQKRLQLS